MWRPPFGPSESALFLDHPDHLHQSDGPDQRVRLADTGLSWALTDASIEQRRQRLFGALGSNHRATSATALGTFDTEDTIAQVRQLERLCEAVQHGMLDPIRHVMASSFVLWGGENEPIADATLILALGRVLFARYQTRELVIIAYQAVDHDVMDVEWRLSGSSTLPLRREPAPPDSLYERPSIPATLTLTGRERLWFDTRHHITDQLWLSHRAGTPLNNPILAT